jgi:hypothetical protein
MQNGNRFSANAAGTWSRHTTALGIWRSATPGEPSATPDR